MAQTDNRDGLQVLQESYDPDVRGIRTIFTDGVDAVIVNSDGSLNVRDLNKLIPLKYDDVEITVKNADGNPTTIVFRASSSTVATLTLTYDADGDLQRVQRV